jgi:hypothetical protein
VFHRDCQVFAQQRRRNGTPQSGYKPENISGSNP